jgi:putative oxidoreductase
MAGASKVAVACAWVIGALFVYAGALKFWRPDLLLADIESYRLLPYRLAYLWSYYLPALEIVGGVALYHRAWRRVAAGLLLALCIVFIVALFNAWARGLDISCGCFGGAETKANYPALIGRDLLLASGLVWILRCRVQMQIAVPGPLTAQDESRRSEPEVGRHSVPGRH